MTYNEAILRIMDHIAVHKIGQFPHYHIAEALKMAIEACEKQIPRTMNLTMKGFLNCPCCKRDIRYPLVENIHYCPYCGQALKWGDD